MHAGITAHMQEGITSFVQQNKTRWEEAQQSIMQVVEESKAKKRKADDTAEPKTPERTSPATSTDPSDVAPAHRVLPPVLAVGGASPPEPTTQTAAPPEVTAPTAPGQAALPCEEARAAAKKSATDLRLKLLREEAMARAAAKVTLAQAEAAAVPIVDGGMDCTS